MKLREKIINEIREIKADQLMQKAPTAVEFVEVNYPEVVDYLSTEGMIAGFLLVLELLDKGENKKTQTPERSFEGWGVYDVESSPTMLPDGSYLRATIDRDEQRNNEGYRLYVAHVIDRGATESNHSEVIMEEHFDDLISALLRLEGIEIKKYLNKIETCTR